MPYLRRPDANLYYHVYGEKTDFCLTLINGTSRTHEDFKAMAGHFQRLGFWVVTLDNRGSGKTECELTFSLEDLALDVAAVWAHLEIKQTHLLGISLGGMIALEVARLHPAFIQNLFLISTGYPSFMHLDPEATNEHTYVHSYFAKGFAEKYPLLIQGLMKQMQTSFYSFAGKPKAVAQRHALKSWQPLEQYLFPFPTYILHGSEDSILPLKAAERLHQTIEPSELRVFEGVGHLLLVEAPKRFYQVVEQIIAEQGSR